MIFKFILIIIGSYLYFYIQKSIISLSVLRTFIFYPFINKEQDIKNIHLIASQSILASFILSPAISFLLLRTIFFKKKFKRYLNKKQLFSNTKLISLEIIVDILTISLNYFFIYYLFSNLLFFRSLSIIIIFAIVGSIIIRKNLIFKNKNGIYIINSFSAENRIITYLFITTNRIFRVLLRDIIFILFIYILFSSDFDFEIIKNSFNQALTFSFSNYIQLLPANLIMPEVICTYFKCLVINFIWLRVALFLATLLNFIFFNLNKEIRFPI